MFWVYQGLNGFPIVCAIGLLISGFVLHLNPAIPCPNFGFTSGTSFTFEITGFMTCFLAVCLDLNL